MQKYIISFASVILLAGCVSGYHSTAQSNAGAREQAGWAQIKSLSADRCGVNPAPPQRAEAVETSLCVTGLVEEYVLPQAALPELLKSSRKEALRIAQEYAAGRISAEEYRLRSQERQRRYERSLAYFLNEQKPASIG